MPYNRSRSLEEKEKKKQSLGDQVLDHTSSKTPWSLKNQIFPNKIFFDILKKFGSNENRIIVVLGRWILIGIDDYSGSNGRENVGKIQWWLIDIINDLFVSWKIGTSNWMSTFLRWYRHWYQCPGIGLTPLIINRKDNLFRLYPNRIDSKKRKYPIIISIFLIKKRYERT